MTQYLMLAAAAVIGATTTSLVAWWWIDQARRTVLTAATTRHKQDVANLATAHKLQLENARRAHEADYADLEANRDECLAGWRDEYQRTENLRDQLDAALEAEAALRGRIADLEAIVADYAQAHIQVPRAWRADVNDLDNDAQDDVWAPALHPAPVLVGLLADPTAPKLPDAWEDETPTQWWARYQEPKRPPTPVQPVRGVRSKHKRKAVAR
jgi:hypothetical protein